MNRWEKAIIGAAFGGIVFNFIILGIMEFLFFKIKAPQKMGTEILVSEIADYFHELPEVRLKPMENTLVLVETRKQLEFLMTLYQAAGWRYINGSLALKCVDLWERYHEIPLVVGVGMYDMGKMVSLNGICFDISRIGKVCTVREKLDIIKIGEFILSQGISNETIYAVEELVRGKGYDYGCEKS